MRARDADSPPSDGNELQSEKSGIPWKAIGLILFCFSNLSCPGPRKSESKDVYKPALRLDVSCFWGLEFDSDVRVLHELASNTGWSCVFDRRQSLAPLKLADEHKDLTPLLLDVTDRLSELSDHEVDEDLCRIENASKFSNITPLWVSPSDMSSRGGGRSSSSSALESAKAVGKDTACVSPLNEPASWKLVCLVDASDVLPIELCKFSIEETNGGDGDASVEDDTVRAEQI